MFVNFSFSSDFVSFVSFSHSGSDQIWLYFCLWMRIWSFGVGLCRRRVCGETVFKSLQFGDFFSASRVTMFDRLFVWLEFGLHSLHSVCFLCSFFDVPGDFLRGPYPHALKLEVVHETFCRSDKMICVYARRGFAGLKRTPPGIYSSCDVLLFSSASLFVLLFVLGKQWWYQGV